MKGSRLEELQKKRAKIESEIKIAKGKENEQKRKDATRKKILYGSLVEKMIEESESEESNFKRGFLNRLDKFLTKENDRRVCGLSLNRYHQ